MGQYKSGIPLFLSGALRISLSDKKQFAFRTWGVEGIFEGHWNVWGNESSSWMSFQINGGWGLKLFKMSNWWLKALFTKNVDERVREKMG